MRKFLDTWHVNNKLLGHVAFLVLGCLAVLYYLERTIFVDPSYAAFNIIYYKDFVTEAARYAAVLPQTLPLLAISFHLPLKIVLITYSVSFILLYYLIFLLIAYVFKNDAIALAVPLVLLMGIKYSFFWISTETHQTLVYNILFFAFLYYSFRFHSGILNNIIMMIIAAGILLLCFFTHPVSLFTVLFILGYVMIDRKLWGKPYVYILGVMIVAIAIIKVSTTPANGYEDFLFQGFLSFFKRIGNFQTSESFIFLKSKIFSLYLFPLLIFIATIVFYLVRRQYLKLIYYIIAILLFLLVVFATFDIWVLPFIEEKILMPLNIFLLMPFMIDVVFTSNRLNLAKQFFLMLLFVVAVGHVISASFYYKERLAYIKNLINQTKQFPEKKFIIGEKQIERNRLNVTWALGPESLLLSSLESPDSSRSVYILDNNATFDPEIDLSDSLRFICTSWAQNLEVRRMDTKYFNLNNSFFRVISATDLHRSGRRIGYVNLFDDTTLVQPGSNYMQDSAGNWYYLLKDEYSPGFYGKYSEMTDEKSIFITATVKVFPLEEVDTKSLNLVISREQGNTVFDYYMSCNNKSAFLKPYYWTTLTVCGVVNNTDKNDLLKVYIYNPAKKKVRMDDLIIYLNSN